MFLIRFGTVRLKWKTGLRGQPFPNYFSVKQIELKSRAMLLEIAQIVIKIRKIILKNKAILEKKIGLNTSRKEERN
jgi:hypothetical protein